MCYNIIMLFNLWCWIELVATLLCVTSFNLLEVRCLHIVYNRHVLVELVDDEEEEKQESLIALPQDYKKQESPYLVVKVLDKAEDCNTFVEVCDHVVIERRMLIEIEIKGEKNYLVLENYIYGRLEDETD